MKKHIFVTGLIILFLNSFISTFVLCEEKSVNENDPEVIAIKEGIVNRMNSFIYNDRENILRPFPANATRLRKEEEENAEYVQQLSDFSCGEPEVLKYEKPNPKTIVFEFKMECKGYDYAASSDVTRVFAKRVTVKRDKEDAPWQVIDSQDINSPAPPDVEAE